MGATQLETVELLVKRADVSEVLESIQRLAKFRQVFGKKCEVYHPRLLHGLLMAKKIAQLTRRADAPALCHIAEEAFGYSRDFLDNRYVYLVISPRAGGLSVGINLNPSVKCTFKCLYCEIDRAQPVRTHHFDVARMAGELRGTLAIIGSGALRRMPRYARLPPDLLQVRHIAISGDGEPTLSRHFVEAIDTLIHLRREGAIPRIKIVVLTNSTALHRPNVRYGLNLLAPADEVWAKLDGGTQQYLDRLNHTSVPIEKILDNILLTARRRPVIIQSLFPAINGVAPSRDEILAYARRLKDLRCAGAHIPLVQVYSAMRPIAVKTGCSHLPLRSLSHIAKTVRKIAGLPAEVY